VRAAAIHLYTTCIPHLHMTQKESPCHSPSVRRNTRGSPAAPASSLSARCSIANILTIHTTCTMQNVTHRLSAGTPVVALLRLPAASVHAVHTYSPCKAQIQRRKKAPVTHRL
jgi:hypothetical protein